ncbi:MAG: TetR/AcrR family transcriptional regulator [Spirochaetes bacterium]|nr:TetR/AcrR family transcriptional regulator [Spirochaetota bacterium]
MPKGFKEEQIKNIRESLLDAARISFSQSGYKKMSIRDLTGQTGIALGTFYKFFKSKEELFFNLLISESNKLENRIKSLIEEESRSSSLIEKAAEIILEELEKNKILEEILFGSELKMIFDSLGEEQIVMHKEKSIKMIMDVMEKSCKKESLASCDAKLAAKSLRAVFFLYFHKNEIGRDEFIDIFRFLVSSITSTVSGGAEE